MKRAWIIVFLVLASGLLVISFFNARPKSIQDTPVDLPTLHDLVPPGTSTARMPSTNDESDIPILMKPNQLIMVTTDRLMKQSCEYGTDNCKLQAIYDFVRKNIEFNERDTETSFIIPPGELLIYAKGDALDLALLIASMQRAAGFRNEIVRTQSGTSTWVRTYIGNTSIMIDPSTQGSPIMAANVHLRGDELIFN